MQKENQSVEERILEAALEVVNKKTISGTRMHLIAAKAELAQANLHYYFRTKKDLLVALLHYIQRDFSQKRAESMALQEDTLRGQLYGFFDQKQKMITEQPELDRVQIDYWSQGQIDPEINQCFCDSYSIWRNHIVDTMLLYEPSANQHQLQLLAGIMVSMMMGASFQYLNDPTTFKLDEYFHSCEDMALLYIEKNL